MNSLKISSKSSSNNIESFRDLLFDSTLNMPVIRDWQFQQYSVAHVIEEFNEKSATEYPLSQIKKHHLEQLRLLLSILNEFHTKINMTIMGRSIN